MNKVEFYLKAILTSAPLKREWVFSVFAVVLTTANKEDYPYKVIRKEDGVFFVNPEDSGNLTLIEGVGVQEPIAAMREEILLPAGHLANNKDPVLTTFGNVLLNELILCRPFRDIIPFQAGYFNLGKVEDVILDRLIDDPFCSDNDSMDVFNANHVEGDTYINEYIRDPDGFYAPDGKIYVRQKLMYQDNTYFMTAFNSITVHSATRKSLLYHPDAQKVKEAFIAEHKDQMNDPAVVARLTTIMKEMDKEYLKGDPSLDFYLKDKYFSVIRMKMNIMFGAQSAFSDGSTVTFISKPLREGMDIKYYPEMNNSLREGSFSRGSQTELGGARTKGIYRAMSPVYIATDDCGTKIGQPRRITEKNASEWVGCYYVDSNKRPVLFDRENVKAFIGKTVEVRTPAYCLAKNPGFCAKCLGDRNTAIKHGLASAAAEATGVMMGVFMSAMHATELTTIKFNPETMIS